MPLIPSPIRRFVEAILEPLIRGLILAGVSPNVLTTIGTFVLVGSGVAFGLGWAHWGGGLLLLSGVFDMLDGRVARGGPGTTRFGAFYDSTLDRVGESALFGGIVVYFVAGGVASEWLIPAVITTIVALSAGLTVSYARARAEGLGLECAVGIAQRAERILGLGIPTLFFGVGPDGWLLLGLVGLLALTSVITVAQRIVHVYQNTRAKRRATVSGRVSSTLSGRTTERIAK